MKMTDILTLGMSLGVSVRFLSGNRECRLAASIGRSTWGHMPLESGNTTSQKHMIQQDLWWWAQTSYRCHKGRQIKHRCVSLNHVKPEIWRLSRKQSQVDHSNRGGALLPYWKLKSWALASDIKYILVLCTSSLHLLVVLGQTHHYFYQLVVW